MYVVKVTFQYNNTLIISGITVRGQEERLFVSPDLAARSRQRVWPFYFGAGHDFNGTSSIWIVKIVGNTPERMSLA